ncbi:hypothetical protein RFI_10622, partial [Reticulomyxa filosa]
MPTKRNKATSEKSVPPPNQHEEKKKNVTEMIDPVNTLPKVYVVIAFVVAIIAFVLIRNKDSNQYVNNSLPFVSSPSSKQHVCYCKPYIRNLSRSKKKKKRKFICDTENWLNRNGSIEGYHVLCVRQLEGEKTALEIEYWVNGHTESDVHSKYVLSDQDMSSVTNLRAVLEGLLQIKQTDTETTKTGFQPWRMFTQFGYSITQKDYLTAFLGTVLVFEGGQFIYPPIVIGK